MLNICLDKFSLNSKNEIVDDNGLLKYWSQYDFSYKRRVHVYDAENNELGYIQYRILSIQEKNDVYDKSDKIIDLSSFKQTEVVDKWNYTVLKDNEIVAYVQTKENKLEIDIKNKEVVDQCLLYVFSLVE